MNGRCFCLRHTVLIFRYVDSKQNTSQINDQGKQKKDYHFKYFLLHITRSYLCCTIRYDYGTAQISNPLPPFVKFMSNPLKTNAASTPPTPLPAYWDIHRNPHANNHSVRMGIFLLLNFYCFFSDPFLPKAFYKLYILPLEP